MLTFEEARWRAYTIFASFLQTWNDFKWKSREILVKLVKSHSLNFRGFSQDSRRGEKNHIVGEWRSQSPNTQTPELSTHNQRFFVTVLEFKWKCFLHVTNTSVCMQVAESESCSVKSDSETHGLYSLWNSPGQNTGVSSCSLLQEIFLTQGLNPGLLHCWWILYQLSHEGSPPSSTGCVILDS